MQCKRKRKIKVLNLTNDILVRRLNPPLSNLYLALGDEGFYILRSLTYLVVFLGLFPPLWEGEKGLMEFVAKESSEIPFILKLKCENIASLFL